MVVREGLVAVAAGAVVQELRLVRVVPVRLAAAGPARVLVAGAVAPVAVGKPRGPLAVVAANKRMAASPSGPSGKSLSRLMHPSWVECACPRAMAPPLFA